MQGERSKTRIQQDLVCVCFFFQLFSYENNLDTWSDSRQPCDIDL